MLNYKIYFVLRKVLGGSHLGQELLLAHEENDLLGGNSPYGDTLNFAGIEKFMHDEL